MFRTLKLSAFGALSLIGMLAWWIGWTSPTSVLTDVDKLRPTAALCKEYEALMLAKAAEVQTQAATIRQLERELKTMETESTSLSHELAKSQDKIGFILSSVRSAQNGQVLVGNKVTLDKQDVERDLKTATQAHRRMEVRKVNLAKNADRIRMQLKGLGEYSDNGRNLLAEMKSKLDSWKISMNSSTANALDPHSIEGELLAAKDRANQIDAELNRRSVGTELATYTLDRNWDRWMSGSTEPDFWIAEAESISGQKSTANSQSSALFTNK